MNDNEAARIFLEGCIEDIEFLSAQCDQDIDSMLTKICEDIQKVLDEVNLVLK